MSTSFDLLVRTFALGDVAHDPRKQSLVSSVNFADAQVDRKDPPCAVLTNHFAADSDDFLLAGIEVIANVAVVLVVIRRRHQQIHILTEHLAGGITEQPLGGGIEGENRARRVNRDDAIDHVLQDRRHPRQLLHVHVGAVHRQTCFPNQNSYAIKIPHTGAGFFGILVANLLLAKLHSPYLRSQFPQF